MSYIVHVDCCGLSTIVIKTIIIIIIITIDASWNRYERLRCRGQKFRGQGHGGINYAGNSSLWAETYNTRHLALSVEFLVSISF